MAVFFVYSYDGREYSRERMEYSPSAENAKRQLASRVRDGKGKSCFVSAMPEISWRGMREACVEAEWLEATEDACMAVWRCRAGEVPSGEPTEMWQYSGQVDRPVVTSPDQFDRVSAFGERKTLDEWAADKRMRVPAQIFTRRLQMGWGVEDAMTVPLGHRYGTIRETSGRVANMSDLPDGRTPTRREVHFAFGMKHTMPEWSRLTGINESTLRNGARRVGLAEYLRRKNWHPEKKRGGA